MDEQTTAAILELHLQDIEELNKSDKGKQQEGSIRDADYAFELYKEELKKVECLLSDRKMASGIGEAVFEDGPVVQNLISVEEVALRDHLLARNLNDQDRFVVKEPEITKTDISLICDEVFEQLTKFNQVNGEIPSFGDHEAVSSSTSSSKTSLDQRDESSLHHDCVVCFEAKHWFDVFETPCHHNYCRDCIQEMFEQATVDETRFPPQCCTQAIPLSSVQDMLSIGLSLRYALKHIEYSTRDRTYCSRPECSTFIAPGLIAGKVGTCPKCSTQTCSICKEAKHEKEDCPSDPDTQSMLSLAEEKHFQRCFACARMIELSIGCNHIV
ncbi:hypothetical protein MMC20_001370 [Loxospora ochrophaea]|nr:hypothetical protein [Loxospora ochrophaea]